MRVEASRHGYQRSFDVWYTPTARARVRASKRRRSANRRHEKGEGCKENEKKSPFSKGVDPRKWCQTQLSRRILTTDLSWPPFFAELLPTVYTDYRVCSPQPNVELLLSSQAMIVDKRQGEFLDLHYRSGRLSRYRSRTFAMYSEADDWIFVS